MVQWKILFNLGILRRHCIVIISLYACLTQYTKNSFGHLCIISIYGSSWISMSSRNVWMNRKLMKTRLSFTSFGFQSHFLKNGEEKICSILPRIWQVNGWILIRWYILIRKQVEMGGILMMGFITQMIIIWTFIYLNKISEVISKLLW